MSLPPSVQASVNQLHTQSFFSEVPESILNISDGDSIILGVDEAGRGPVMGPMVYGIAYCSKKYMDDFIIPNYEFDDSKKLTDSLRRTLFEKIYGDAHEIDNLGYATTAITASDISSGMSRFPPAYVYNLNEQAHDTTMNLIQGVIDRDVVIDHVYVDTVGPPQTYQKKLETRFPNVKFTVTKKADSLFCIVSVASVVAKVTRDFLVENFKRTDDEVLGSGYPSDPNTKKWLKLNQTQLFGWPNEMIRFSWQTCATLLDESKTGLMIDWEEDFMNKKQAKEWEKTKENMANQPKTLESWYF